VMHIGEETERPKARAGALGRADLKSTRLRGSLGLEKVLEFAAVVEGGGVVAAADRLAIDEDIGHGANAGELGRARLDRGVCLGVEHDHVLDVVVPEDGEGALAEGAPGLGDHDHLVRGESIVEPHLVAAAPPAHA